jgi:hypothetical protein
VGLDRSNRRSWSCWRKTSSVSRFPYLHPTSTIRCPVHSANPGACKRSRTIGIQQMGRALYRQGVLHLAQFCDVQPRPARAFVKLENRFVRCVQCRYLSGEQLWDEFTYLQFLPSRCETQGEIQIYEIDSTVAAQTFHFYCLRARPLACPSLPKHHRQSQIK